MARARAKASAANAAADGPGRENAIVLLSEIRDRINRLDMGRRAGITYGGQRDIQQVGGYPQNPGIDDFKAMYDRDPIAGRGVDMIAETTWRHPPSVTGSTQFNSAWKAVIDRLRPWERCERADKLARLGRYSVMLLGVRGVDDRTLTEPMETSRAVPASDILFLSVFDESRARITQWETDPLSERFGMPRLYQINFAGDLMGGPGGLTQVSIHATRLIHVAAETLYDDVFGRPVLRRVFNDLLDLQKIRTSSAEAFWQRVAGILQALIDKDVQGFGVTEQKELDDKMLELTHDLRRFIVGKGMKLERLGDSEPDPEHAAKLAQQCIASGLEYPMRMLFGSETGERASTEDQKAYLGSVRERQTTFAEPSILRPLIDRLISMGVLPGGTNGSKTTDGAEKKAPYEVSWPDLMEESPTDQATANLSRAQAAKELTPVGGDPLLIVEIDEDSNIWLLPRKKGEESPFTPPEPIDPAPIDPATGKPIPAATGDGGAPPPVPDSPAPRNMP